MKVVMSTANTRGRPRWLLQVTAFAALVVTFGLVVGSGYGSSPTRAKTGTKTSDIVSQAKAAIAAAEKPGGKFRVPGPAFNARSVRGKTIWALGDLAVPYFAQNAQGIKEAAAAAHATAHIFSSNPPTVDAYTRGISQAIAQKAAAILVGGLDTHLFATQLRAARSKGIKVIGFSGGPGTQLPAKGDFVNGYADPCYPCAGRLMADYAIAKSNGSADAIVFWSSDVVKPGNAQLNPIKAEFKKCSGCKLSIVDVPEAQWTTLQSATQAALVRDPNAKYLLPLYDGMVPFMTPAVRGKSVKVVSFNASPSVMQEITPGGFMEADVGAASIRYGWSIADQTFRAIAGKPPVASEKLPVRIFDLSNIKSINPGASTDTWYGGQNYRARYKKLWGLTR
jgi:ribose transport system substrate-binding protein